MQRLYGMEIRMFENLTVVAVIMIVAWMGLLFVYMGSSRQQGELEAEVEAIEALLGEDVE